MEQFQQNSHKLEGEGETDGQYNGEGSERNNLDGEVLEVSYDVGNKIILHQPELCAIYTAIYWAWKPDGTPWSDIEIKQIVGHAILGLDEDSYHRLDLSDVIKLFHNEKDDLTRAVKPIAEELKSILVSWIPQQYEKYLDLCRQDIRLTEQRDNENFAQQAQNQTRPMKRRCFEKPKPFDSIAAVLARSSSESQDL